MAVIGGMYYVGVGTSWSPAGWVLIGVATIAVTAYTVYKVYKKCKVYKAEHKKIRGSKKRTNDKHTKSRSGRKSEKKKQKPGWRSRH